MAFRADQIVYPCREYEDVALPIKTLLGSDGKLDIYPDVAGKGYFDIDYRKGELVFKAKGKVGLIPVSDRAAIRVEPRTPIANLLYMIWRAGVEMTGLRKYVRGYREIPGSVPDPETLYVGAFLSAMSGAGRIGLLKKYSRVESEREKRGRLLPGKTISRFRSRGIRDKHSFEFHEHTVNGLENRIIKSTAIRLLRRVSGARDAGNIESARQLRGLLGLFEPVIAGEILPEQVARDVPRLIRSLPNSHRFYEPALWLAYLIATRSGVKMESVGRAKFESVIIDMAEVFERYVRKVCAEKAAMCFDGCNVVDGNHSPAMLFEIGGRFPTKPDIYFKKGRVCRALADAKYKPRVSSEDRYELLAFCESLDVKSAAFICPAVEGEPIVSHHGTTRSGTVIHIVRIDLSAPRPELEEAVFSQRLAKSLGF